MGMLHDVQQQNSKLLKSSYADRLFEPTVTMHGATEEIEERAQLLPRMLSSQLPAGALVPGRSQAVLRTVE